MAIFLKAAFAKDSENSFFFSCDFKCSQDRIYYLTLAPLSAADAIFFKCQDVMMAKMLSPTFHFSISLLFFVGWLK